MKKILLVVLILITIITLVSCTPPHKHKVSNELEVVKEATCGNDGTYNRVCETCGKTIETITVSATGAHYYTDWIDVQSGGCAAVSYRVKACVVCGYTLFDADESIDVVHPHKFELITKEPTCTEEGIFYKFECENCGFVAAEETLPALGHDLYGNRYEYISKSHHAETCKRCNEYVFETHSCKNWTTVEEASCEKDGLKVGVCSKCGGDAEKIININHYFAFTINIKEPTCEEEGIALYTCTKCGATETRTVSKLDHEFFYLYTKVEANCTEKGIDIYQCPNCLETIEEVSDPLHSFDGGVITVQPTCTQKGSIVYTCVLCNAQKKYELTVRHDTTHHPEQKPTCTENGNIEYWECLDCGKYFSKSDSRYEYLYYDGRVYLDNHHTAYNYIETSNLLIDKLGHNYTERFNEYDDQNHWRACLNDCGSVVDREEHELIEDFGVGVEAVDNGYIYTLSFSIYCTKCDYSKSNDSSSDPDSDLNGGNGAWNSITEFHEHNMFDKLNGVKPTCTKDGLTPQLICGVCGDVLFENQIVVPALGHSFKNGVCIRCGLCDETKSASEGLEFALNSDKQSYSVVGIGTCQDTELIIPSVHNGLPVTSIRSYAFFGCDSLTSVVIPESMTSIGESVFEGCSSLNYNEYDNAYYLGNENNPYVVLIGAKNKSIRNCNIHSNTKVIGGYAFADCELITSIIIPDFVTSIGMMAFYECTSLTNVVIGDSVANIGSSAFSNCNSLTSIEIPDSVMSIGEGAFASCRVLKSIEVDVKNKNYKSMDGNLYTKDGTILIQYAIGKEESSFTIPSFVISIGNKAFGWCESLLSVIIPDNVLTVGDCSFISCHLLENVVISDSVISIGNQAFCYCYSLLSVNIPDSVTSIGEGAFSYCTSLTSIEVDVKNKNYKSMDGNLYTKDGTILIQYSVGKEESLFTIPNFVTNIDDSAFADCAYLTRVEIPNSVTIIGAWAFFSCRSLESIVIPDSVTSIAHQAFIYCNSLESVVIPDSVTVIDTGAFCYCYSLTHIVFEGTAEQWNAIEKGAEWNLYVPVSEVICSDGIVYLNYN